MRVPKFVRLQSAPVVIGAVLALFLGAMVVTTVWSPAVRLSQILERLPPAISVVLLPSEAPMRAEGLVVSFLGLPQELLPPQGRPAAILALEVDGRRRALALVEAVSARAAGQRGPLVSGFTIVGDQDAAERLAADIQGGGFKLPKVLRQFLRTPAESTELRLLLRPGVALSALPAELRSSLGTDLVGLRLLDEGRDLRFSGLASWGSAPAGRTAPILGRVMDEALLVLDGVAVADLFPPSLPPLLEALKAATGVRAELNALAEALRGNSGVIVILASAGGRVDLVGGFLASENRDQVVAAARVLLQKRLALHGAATEVVRAGGLVIRHRRPPGAGSPLALVDREVEGWHVIRAPRAAGTADLIAAWNEAVFLLGTSEDAVLRVAPHLRTVPGSLDLRFSLQVERLRKLAVVRQVLAAFPLSLRKIVSALELVDLEVEQPKVSSFRFRGSARFSTP